MNLATNLSRASERSGDSVAIEFEGAELTFGALENEARRAASSLAELGVAPGDRVALWTGNHPSFASVLYGVWRAGAIAVPMHAMLTEPEARHILADSGAKVVVCGTSQYDKLADTDPRVTPASLFGGSVDGSIASVGDDDIALLGYTSGTSGVPKGAMLTHANLRANLEQMKASPIAVGPGDVVLCILPLFHIFGLNVVLNLSIDVGAKIILHERFDAAATIAELKERAVTVVCGAPPAYVGWLAVPDAPADAFSSVNIAVSGAAPLAADVLTEFDERFGVTIWEGYGLTETAPAVTFTAMGGVAKPGSIGRPLPGVEVRLIDEDGEVIEEDGDPGEIVVRGANVFKGYWGHPEQTAEVFVDGWFKTGDVAVADDDGDLYIVDRMKDMILVSGFNVYPREVENVLRRHPGVGDCAVVGAPDAVSGESVRAIVVADPPGETVSAESVIEFCAKSLAPYKVPSRIDVVSEIPRNVAGKVLRRVLRD